MMIKNSLQFLFLSVLLIFGIIIGISFAEHGINRVAGNSETPPQSFYVTQTDQKLAIKVLGKTVETQIQAPDSEQKQNNNSQVTTNQTNKTNNGQGSETTPFLSKVGNKLGHVIQIGTEKGLNYLSKIIIN